MGSRLVIPDLFGIMFLMWLIIIVACFISVRDLIILFIITFVRFRIYERK